MNQQDAILPFCKSVKILYSGVKKLYSRKVFHALLQHISAVFSQQVLHGQVAFLVALGIQSE